MRRPTPSVNGIDALTALARTACEAAAVIGAEVELDLLLAVNGKPEGIDALLESGMLRERVPGLGSFLSARIREEAYSSIPWTRRRALHARVAVALQERHAAAELIASHWSAAGQPAVARRALLGAAQRARNAHQHMETVRLLRLALELWSPDEEKDDRLVALEHLGDAAQAAGRLADALLAWREVADSAQGPNRARALRKTANLHELSCNWEPALQARLDAMDAFAAAQEPAEAAIEGIAAALRLRLWARHAAALEVLLGAARHAQAAGRADLRLRVSALEGNMRARLGHASDGIAALRTALDAALELNDAQLVGEIHKYLGDAFFRSTDFAQATALSLQGVAFCESRDAGSGVVGCLGCMICILSRCGRWDEGLQICTRVLGSPATDAKVRAQALAYAGLMHALKGEGRKAEPLLLEADAMARRIQHVLAELVCRWGFALRDAASGDDEAAARRCHAILSRLRRTDEKYYALPILRWASTCFARVADREGVRACIDAFGAAAETYSHAEPLSALAHALGEAALLRDDVAGAAQQFEHAIELLDGLELPRERAESRLRASMVYARSGQHALAVARAQEAAREASSLGARPLCETSERWLRQIMQRPDNRARGALGARLSPRQAEVLGHVSRGLTDKEIARCLNLSPRTVEMHVARTLVALDCRSRAEAVRKASELGMLAARPATERRA